MPSEREFTRADLVNKRAIDLMPGDECWGPMIFVDRGVVKNTVVVDRGVQVLWEDGLYTIRPEGYEFWVLP